MSEVEAKGMDKLEKIPVKFVASDRVYNPGEVAGFSPSMAKALVESGRAVFYQPDDVDSPSEEKVPEEEDVNTEDESSEPKGKRQRATLKDEGSDKGEE